MVGCPPPPASSPGPRLMLATLNRLSSACQTSPQWSPQRQSPQSRTGDGTCRRRIGHEGFEPRARHAGIGGVVRQPKRRARAVAQFDMGDTRAPHPEPRSAGRNRAPVAAHAWDAAALQLGVGHLVAERAERRGRLDPLQKVRPAAPVARQERPLKHDLRPAASAARVASAFLRGPVRAISTTPPPGRFSRARWRASCASPCFWSSARILAVLARRRPVPRTWARSRVVA